MTNRVSALALAAVLAAAPFAAFAHDHGDKSGEHRDGARAELKSDFRGFFNFGHGGDQDRKEHKEKHENNGVRADGNVEARIEMRLDKLNALIDRIEDSERLAESEKDRLIDGIEAQIALLEGLQARVEAGETKADVKADLKLALKGKFLAMPKAASEAAAERVLRIVDRMEDLADRLDARIDEARDDGENVDVSVEAHADLVAHLNDARVEANAALDLLADLSTDDDDVDENRQILLEVREHLKDAHESLTSARAEIKVILEDLDIEKDDVE